MSLSLLCSIIDDSCLKKEFTVNEYKRVVANSVPVNATTLYRWYTNLGGTLHYKSFYAKLKELFYYDKYVCTHGTEFMYHITFINGTYIERMPTDVIKVIKAIGGKYGI